jgi:molybdopterin converting factor small subunit
MAGATSDRSGRVTLEFHGALADRFLSLGARHGSRTRVSVPVSDHLTVADLLSHLVDAEPRYAQVFDRSTQSLPEHVELVLNDRLLDLQGGLDATVQGGDVLAFLPAHAGG